MAFGVTPEQDLGQGDTDEFGVGELSGAARAAALVRRREHMVVEMDVECCQKGVKVIGHTLILDALRHARSGFRDFPSTI
ncbi:hypothetical protein [Nocardiopsis changdeensis]|uniref:hypothetical protein n=1 Tax=Nocardiopsis changdeensis TaxID=2831969 RepID=UPI003B977027